MADELVKREEMALYAPKIDFKGVPNDEKERLKRRFLPWWVKWHRHALNNQMIFEMAELVGLNEISWAECLGVVEMKIDAAKEWQYNFCVEVFEYWKPLPVFIKYEKKGVLKYEEERKKTEKAINGPAHK